MSDIKILIAAHKESELPKNELFLPIEVGAANRKQHLKGYQRDDIGDNISKKNPNYCELTAIYWGWKNLNCDFLGIFHYRRFYSFSEKRYPVSKDGRKMIRWPAATQGRFSEFGLLDEEKMREVIEANDLVVAESQNVRKIYTPRNRRRGNVLKHYIDHEDCIIKMRDLNLALEIASEKFPEVAPYINKYMHQKMYLGYNMWIAKKAIYDEICDFMFSVLFEVEKKINIRHYGAQMSRVYGYLAEVLSSAYIYYIRQTREISVAEQQMIYIEDTEKVTPILTGKNVCSVIFDLTTPVKTQYLPMLFEPCFEKFLMTLNKKQKYNIAIFYNDDTTPITQNALAAIRKTVGKYKNCSLSLLDLKLELSRQDEKFDPKKSLLDYLDILPIECEKAVYFKWSTIVNEDPAKLFKLGTRKPIIATADLLEEGKMNQFKSKTLARLNEMDLTYADVFEPSVMLINPKKAGTVIYKNRISDEFRRKNKLSEKEVLWLTFKGEWGRLAQDWNFRVPLYPGDEFDITLAPAKDFLKRPTMDKAKVVSFEFESVCAVGTSEFYGKYFELMRKSAAYPYYLGTVMQQKKFDYIHSMVMTGKFPVGSPRRELLSKMFPHGTRRRDLINRVIRIFLH